MRSAPTAWQWGAMKQPTLQHCCASCLDGTWQQAVWKESERHRASCMCLLSSLTALLIALQQEQACVARKGADSLMQLHCSPFRNQPALYWLPFSHWQQALCNERTWAHRLDVQPFLEAQAIRKARDTCHAPSVEDLHHIN